MPTPRKPDSTTPQAAGLPAFASEGDHRIYEDAAHSGRLCVDALEPRLRSGGMRSATPPRDGRSARPVGVVFGPSEGALRRVHELYREHRATPLTWQSGPWFAWSRKAGGVHMIAHGETRRGHAHEAEIHGRQPEGVELIPAVTAAELVHWGRLRGVTLEASAARDVPTAVCQAVRVGRRAPWTATLGDALTAVLTDLLRRNRLRIVVASAPLPLRAFEEIRELVVMEWAHRMAGAHPLSLPAAQIGGLIHDPALDLDVHWRDGDHVPLRVVRALRYESLAADSLQALGWGLGAAGRQRVVARA